MIFARPTLKNFAFGSLDYGSRYWKGQAVLEGFEQAFSLIVRASKEGPSQAQAAAFSQVCTYAPLLKKQATLPMCESHEVCGLLPHSCKNAREAIWQNLRPEAIEITDETYYNDGRIAGILIFSSLLNADFFPAIETADGVFVQVLSGS